MEYPWQTQIPYNDYSTYVRRTWGQRVQKLSVDAGFSCPNRDGSLGRSGCAYCVNASFVPSYCDPKLSLADQIQAGIAFFSWKYQNQGYLVYFQANSNTYTDPDNLRRLLDEALCQPGVLGIVIGTRPDTLSDQTIAVLAEFARKTYLNVEIGIESSLDSSLEAIGRGHDFAATVDACSRLLQHGIQMGGHIILGLPRETSQDFNEHARKLNQLPLSTLKIHHLQILAGTAWATTWRRHPDFFSLFSLEDYVTTVIDFLERLRPNIVIERLCNESPESMLLAPRWGGIKNFAFTHRVVERMLSTGQWQGRLYNDINKYLIK
jgi:radical SAM protein (TIGR01212 family)